MTRLSKQTRDRARSPRKHKKPRLKTGSLKDQLSKGYKEHANALENTELKDSVYISKIK
jgi:hypothetical protein